MKNSYIISQSGLLRWVFALLITTFLLSSGCTIIGLSLGTIGDATKSNYISLEPNVTIELKPGAAYRFKLKNGDVLAGKFVRWEREPTKAYIKAFSRVSRHEYVPVYGDSIVVTTKSGKQYYGRFYGFDHPHIAILSMPSRPGLTRIILDDLKVIADSRGNRFDIETMIAAIDSNQVPIITNLIVNVGTQTRRIGINEVAEIEQRQKKTGKLFGFLFGAAVDLAVFLAVAISYGI